MVMQRKPGHEEGAGLPVSSVPLSWNNILDEVWKSGTGKAVTLLTLASFIGTGIGLFNKADTPLKPQLKGLATNIGLHAGPLNLAARAFADPSILSEPGIRVKQDSVVTSSKADEAVIKTKVKPASPIF